VAADTADDGTDDVPSSQEEWSRRRLTRKEDGSTRRYRTSSGLEIFAPNGATLGQRAVIVEPINATLWDEQAESHSTELFGEENEFAYMLDNLVVREELIMEEVSS